MQSDLRGNSVTATAPKQAGKPNGTNDYDEIEPSFCEVKPPLPRQQYLYSQYEENLNNLTHHLIFSICPKMVSEIGLSTEDLDFSSFSNTINGEKRITKSTIYGMNTTTLEALYPVPVSTKADIDGAIVVARKQRLQAFAEGLLFYRNEFSHILTKVTDSE